MQCPYRRNPALLVAPMPIPTPRLFRGTSVGLALLVVALALTACDHPPTADHPLVHLYVGTYLDGRPLPTTVCPQNSVNNGVIDSMTFATIGGDSAVARTVYRSVTSYGSRYERRFRFAVRDDRVVVLDAEGRDSGVYGTFRGNGIDVTLPSIICLPGDGEVDTVTPAVRFELSC